jgi:hypothetical protein
MHVAANSNATTIGYLFTFRIPRPSGSALITAGVIWPCILVTVLRDNVKALRCRRPSVRSLMEKEKLRRRGVRDGG